METGKPLPIHTRPIAVTGNINLDIKTGLIPSGEGVLADGETSIEEIYESLGGGAANTALAAASLGGRVCFFGCVGSDELGARLEAGLAEHGIAAYLRHKECATGRSINLNWADGSRHFVSCLPNNRLMTAEDIDVDAMVRAGCGQLLRADVWFSEAMLAEGNHDVLTRAKKAGLETYLDINWDPEWSVAGNEGRVRQRRQQLRRVLPLINVAHGNERELRFFSGCEDIRDACRYLVDEGCSMVAVHRGERGAASFTATEGWVEVAASAVENIVCSTGCGDVFCAAHMLLDELETRERLKACAHIAAEHLSGRRILIPRLDGKGVTG